MGVSIGRSVALGSGGSTRVIASSGAELTLTGTTTSTELATVVIPGGSMGPNGCLRVATLWSCTNSANNKIIKCMLNGTFDMFNGHTMTTTAGVKHERFLWNRNSESAQVQFGAWGDSYEASSAAATAAINTAVDVNLVFSGQLALGTETLKLLGYTVEIIRA